MPASYTNLLPVLEHDIPEHITLKLSQCGLLRERYDAVLALGLLHRSGHLSVSCKSREDLLTAATEGLRALGKSVLGIYIATECCDSRKYDSIGKANIAQRHMKQQLREAVFTTFELSSGCIFGNGVTDSEKTSS